MSEPPATKLLLHYKVLSAECTLLTAIMQVHHPTCTCVVQCNPAVSRQYVCTRCASCSSPAAVSFRHCLTHRLTQLYAQSSTVPLLVVVYVHRHSAAPCNLLLNDSAARCCLVLCLQLLRESLMQKIKGVVNVRAAYNKFMKIEKQEVHAVPLFARPCCSLVLLLPSLCRAAAAVYARAGAQLPDVSLYLPVAVGLFTYMDIYSSPHAHKSQPKHTFVEMCVHICAWACLCCRRH